MTADQGGPRWLGIGAQRGGSSWFTELLTQHPQVSLSRADQKELHFFDRFITDLPTRNERNRYRELFDGDCAGEFTPGYLRWPWVPDLARRVCGTDVVLFVLLRDPVERFVSLLRYGRYRWERSAKSRAEPPRGWITDNGTSGIWGGMYAQHLRIWLEHFPREQFFVAQYEAMQRDPQAVIDRAWDRLGVEPGPALEGIDNPSKSSIASGDDVSLRKALRKTLIEAYERDVRQTARVWGIDLTLWPNFAHLAE
jgi:hypothetical protein